MAEVDRLASVRPGLGFRTASLWAVAGLAAGLAGCEAEPPGPVARLITSPAEVELGYPQSTVVSAEWHMAAPLAQSAADPSAAAWIFVHLRDATGAIVRTYDHPLPFSWSPGETRRADIELWQSALAPPLPSGDYDLTVGLYRVGTDHRWLLETEGPEVYEREYRVSRVRVPASEAGPEMGFVFRGSLQAAEEGADRQVLVRRSLQHEGTIDITGLPGPVEVQLGLAFPAPTSTWRIVLLEGAARAELRISSPCAEGEEEVLETPGNHRVALTLRAPEGGRCTVNLEPSFVLVSLDSLEKRSASLERISVSTASP